MLSILVCPSYFLRFDQKQQERAKPYPPLATLQVAAQLRKAGHRVSLFDAMLAEGTAEFRRQLQAAKCEWLAITHFKHAMLRPHAMPIQARSPSCRQCQFVPRDMIAVRVRNKASRLATAHVDRQLGRRQKQSSVIVKQNAPRLTIVFDQYQLRSSHFAPQREAYTITSTPNCLDVFTCKSRWAGLKSSCWRLCADRGHRDTAVKKTPRPSRRSRP